MSEELAQEMPEKSYDKVPPQLRKYVFKPGQIANPGGRPKGSKSMKQYAKEYLETLPEEDRVAFLNSVDHRVIWEMAEGKAKQDLDVTGEMVSKIINVDE
jgi:hypothetical protein